MNNEENKVFDKVLLERRSIRKFKPEAPPKEMVETVIRSGFLAPFAGLAGFELKDVRKFFVFAKSSESMTKAEKIIMAQLQKSAKKLNFAVKVVPYMKKNAKPFAARVAEYAKNGVPAFKTAPYYIVIAERKGFPPAQKQSLAHVLENMWLKATALGLGFQLVSLTGTLSENKEFMSLLGLPCGAYELDGCALGFPDQTPAPREVPAVSETTKWM